jgi:pimeloyl-ACP methyl ester carboxylesterase
VLGAELKEKIMSQRRLNIVCILLMIGLLPIGRVFTQADAPPEPRDVQIEAADGLMLAGTFYAPPTDVIPAEGWPTVLLMHMLDSSRQAWLPLIPSLQESSYNVLAVDLRGHGETGGTRDWPAAAEDVQIWLDWLRAQPTVRGDAISIVGASVGANLALIGCGNDADCVTAVAMSPVLPFARVEGWTVEATAEALESRSVMLVAAQLDNPSAFTVRDLVDELRGEVGVRIYSGGYHGTYLFGPGTVDSVTALIVGWLDEHTPE